MKDLDEAIKKLKNLYYNNFNFDLDSKEYATHPLCINFKILLTLKSNTKEFQTFFLYNFSEPYFRLKEIFNFNKNDFIYYKNRLLNPNADFNSYFGDKFESFIYFTLIEKKLKFEKKERPDFKIILDNNKLLGIESGTCQFNPINDELTFEKVKLKLKRSLKSKLKKEYASFSTALFFDVTNLHYYNFLSGSEEKKIHDFINSYLNKNATIKYGAIVIFYSNIIEDKSGERGHFWATKEYINKNCDVDLFEFLKRNSSNKPKMINEIIYPKYS